MAEAITVSLNEDVVEALNADLEYGDNRSALVEAALREYLDSNNSNDHQSRTLDACPVCGEDLNGQGLPRHFRNGCPEVSA